MWKETRNDRGVRLVGSGRYRSRFRNGVCYLRTTCPMTQLNPIRGLFGGGKAMSRLVKLGLGTHAVAVFSMSLFGPAAVFPTLVDSNGVGIGFAVDGLDYRFDAAVLAHILRHRGFIDWAAYPAFFHTKLYSLSFALFDPWSDFSVLSAEPVNALIYLSIIALVFKIGAEVCDRRVGTLSAAIVAFWPSFWLHTTQILREPQIIAAILVLVLIGVRWLKEVYHWGGGLVTAGIGGLALAVVWLVRGEMWEVMVALVFLEGVLLISRQVYERRILVGNLLGVALLIMLTAMIPRAVRRYMSAPAQLTAAAEPAEAQAGTVWTHLPTRISLIRHRFISGYPEAGSNIDANVELTSMGDIARYVPRALATGFFAPFPNMWFVPGAQVGRRGRLLSGFETVGIYLIEVLAVVCLWRRWRQLSVWLLVIACLISLTALGLVVVNVSVIYRLRYPFFMLLIVLGADGAVRILSLLSGRKLSSSVAASPV